MLGTTPVTLLDFTEVLYDLFIIAASNVIPNLRFGLLQEAPQSLLVSKDLKGVPHTRLCDGFRLLLAIYLLSEVVLSYLVCKALMVLLCI